MNSLLKRQIKKHFDAEMQKNSQVENFVDSVHKSYLNYEEKLELLQRAITISSEELSDVNQKLLNETEEQKKLIETLRNATKTLHSITYKQRDSKSGKPKELDGVALANMIEQQANKISLIERQRELILNDLEKSNKELRDYAQIVSHDLKSPLRNIMTLINWIKEDSPEMDPSTQSHFASIEENIEKMDNLISGILEYSIADKIEEHKHPIDLNQLLGETVNMLHAPDQVDIIIMNKLPVIYGDKTRLRQLFQNLISNAINSVTVRDEGEIKIGCEETDGFWQFYIKDNGKGIDEKYHHKIFEIFQTLDKDSKSTGIGLSIVKKIVSYYEGTIWLESKINKGSTFYFTLKKQK